MLVMEKPHSTLCKCDPNELNLLKSELAPDLPFVRYGKVVIGFLSPVITEFREKQILFTLYKDKVESFFWQKFKLNVEFVFRSEKQFLRITKKVLSETLLIDFLR